MIIKFGELGTHLGTRFKGACVRVQIIEGFKKCEKIEFDFFGVETVSTSFADECFAKLIFSFDLENITKTTSFRNASPYILTIINNAYHERRYSIKTAVNRSVLIY
jgi:hypothetical protein